MPEGTPVLDTLADMTAASIARSGLDPDELVLVRLAALASVDARPISYLAHVGAAMETGVTVERVQDVLTTIAPIVGSARVVAAAINIAEALGFAIAVAEEAAAGAEPE